MSAWKRGFLEIVTEILASLMQFELKKISISNKCNLDSRTCTKYLAVMQSIKLVKKSENDHSIFEITKKGMDFHNEYKKLIEIIEMDLERMKMIS